jgi:hypothetical protein
MMSRIGVPTIVVQTIIVRTDKLSVCLSQAPQSPESRAGVDVLVVFGEG